METQASSQKEQQTPTLSVAGRQSLVYTDIQDEREMSLSRTTRLSIAIDDPKTPPRTEQHPQERRLLARHELVRARSWRAVGVDAGTWWGVC